jgi:hypothetical protein
MAGHAEAREQHDPDTDDERPAARGEHRDAA